MWGRNLTLSLSTGTSTEDRIFNFILGDFLHDVELKNITFTTGLLTVQECNTRGYTVQEHTLLDNTKGFSLQVPFDADVVLKMVWKLVWEYLLLHICSINQWRLCRILNCWSQSMFFLSPLGWWSCLKRYLSVTRWNCMLRSRMLVRPVWAHLMLQNPATPPPQTASAFSAALPYRHVWREQFLPVCEIWQSKGQFQDLDWSSTIGGGAFRTLQLPGKRHPLQLHRAIRCQGHSVWGMLKSHTNHLRWVTF